MFRTKAVALYLLSVPAALQAQALDVRIDDAAASAVVAAVQNTSLSKAKALEVARLPGNRGLVEKARTYGHDASVETLANALLEVASGKPGEADKIFRFSSVKDNAASIETALRAMTDPNSGVVDRVRSRIVLFTPRDVKGKVAGFLVAGGTSGGFALGKPEFFLNLNYFQAPAVAETVMMHELYHAVQNMAVAIQTDSPGSERCAKSLPNYARLMAILDPLMAEGTASYVGDVIAMPDSPDPRVQAERDRMQLSVDLSYRAIILLELALHAASTNAPIKDENIYALGFYDDEILYSLGYIMTKAIVAEKGPEAVAELIGMPGSAFAAQYLGLKAYGTQAAPRLGKIAEEAIRKADACRTQS